MVTQADSSHVDNFLLSIDPKSNFSMLTARIVAAAVAGTDSRHNLALITAWIDAKVDLLVYEHKLQSDSEGTTILLGAIYLKALEALRETSVSRIRLLQDGQRLLKVAPRLLEAIESDFVSELLAELQARCKRDQGLLRTLTEARHDLGSLSSLFPDVFEELRAIIEPADLEKTTDSPVTRMPGQPRQPSGRCSDYIGSAICTVVMVIIIVVVIATK